MDQQPIQRIGERHYLIATSVGTVRTSTLALVLRALGYSIDVYDGFLDVHYEKGIKPIDATLNTIADGAPNSLEIVLPETSNLITEKFHSYLSSELLLEDALSSRLDLDALPSIAQRLLENRT